MRWRGPVRRFPWRWTVRLARGAPTFGNIWPCFLTPYQAIPGTLAGEVVFDPVVANNFSGALRWHVEAATSGSFSDDVTLTGSYYFEPTPAAPALLVKQGAGNVRLMLTHRDAALDPPNLAVTLDSSSRFPNLPFGSALTLNPRTGLFRGHFLTPVSGVRQRLSGALLKSENRGAGLFDAFIGHGHTDLLPVP